MVAGPTDGAAPGERRGVSPPVERPTGGLTPGRSPSAVSAPAGRWGERRHCKPAKLDRRHVGLPIALASLPLAVLAFWAGGVVFPAVCLCMAGAIVVVLFLAGVISGLSGFAFSAVAACVLWLLPPLQAIPLICCCLPAINCCPLAR